MSGLDVNRREFLKITAGASAALATPTLGQSAGTSFSKMMGIQVGAISFADEGTEKVLDVLQERACVNTLFLAVFTYGRGIAARQIPGQPLPDPKVGKPFPVLVPQVDVDGNERDGVRLPEITVPLATYTGWRTVRR
jgi:hypothetical protein